MSKNRLTRDFRKGNIPKQLLLFMLPFMASNALQVFYSTVDMIIVGKFVGTAGISAVGQSSLIVNFVTMVSLGFSNAGQVLVSQALGADKKKEVNEIIGTLFTMILSLGLVLSGVILLLQNNTQYNLTDNSIALCYLYKMPHTSLINIQILDVDYSNSEKSQHHYSIIELTEYRNI